MNDTIIVWTLIVAFVLLTAWICAIVKLIDIHQEKRGANAPSGSLWFIGVFASPIVLGLIVAAEPVVMQKTYAAPAPKYEDELPAI